MPTTLDILVQQRRKILEQMRAREPELVREFEVIDATIGSLGSDSGPPLIYTRYSEATDAVRAFLGKIMRTEDFSTIAETIVKFGWLAGNPNALKNARAAIKYQVDNSDRRKILKRFPSGRIGLYDWPLDFDEVRASPAPSA